MGAKVNGRLVVLSNNLIAETKLKLLDQIRKPRKDWLRFVTSVAKSKIKNALKEEKN